MSIYTAQYSPTARVASGDRLVEKQPIPPNTGLSASAGQQIAPLGTGDIRPPSQGQDRDLLDGQIEKSNQQLPDQDVSARNRTDNPTKSLVGGVGAVTGGRVIRQTPPDELLAYQKYIQGYRGAVFDKQG